MEGMEGRGVLEVGAARRSRRSRGGRKKQPGLNEKREVFGSGHHQRRGRGGREKMRSYGDLDSKTLRQKRQGLTLREPPHPLTLIPLPHQNNNREERSHGRRGARAGDASTPPGPALPPPRCCIPAAVCPSNLWNFLEGELGECWGRVWINFCF